MRELRPVNHRIGNLRSHIASRVHVEGDLLSIQFESTSNNEGAFCVLLEGVLDSVDYGLVFQPLTAGIVWKPVGQFGLAAASRLGEPRLENLIELRLDHEDRAGLACRFQAVAFSAKICEGSINDHSDTVILMNAH